MNITLSQSKAHAMIDAVDEGSVEFSTGFAQRSVAPALVEAIQELLFEAEDDDDIVVELGNDNWDAYLVLLQMMEAS